MGNSQVSGGTREPKTARTEPSPLERALETSRRLVWSELTPQAEERWPAPRNSQGSCTHGPWLYVYGGRTPDGRLNDLWAFNCDTRQWRCLETNDAPQGPDVRSGCLLVHDGSHSLYLGFGYDREPVAHNALYRYDLYDRTWTLLRPNGPAPPPRINFRGWFCLEGARAGAGHCV